MRSFYRLSICICLALLACRLAQPRPAHTRAAPPSTPTNLPTPQARRAGWQPTPRQPIHWSWQLSGNFTYPQDVLPGVTVYDLDGELTPAETVAQLHALDPQVIVICYFDAGIWESYRSDAAAFPKSLIGNPVSGWENHYWLDIRQTDTLRPLLQARMQQWCKDKGFDAVEPDDTEVWLNNPGFPITRQQNRIFNQQIAQMAHDLGLSVGLKNNTTEAPDLWPYFDWALNEQCFQFSECEALKTSFLAHNKAVFNIEYERDPDCALANAWHMNAARRDLDLLNPSDPAYRYAPCIPDTLDAWPDQLKPAAFLPLVRR